jgi:hypothetical protein
MHTVYIHTQQHTLRRRLKKGNLSLYNDVYKAWLQDKAAGLLPGTQMEQTLPLINSLFHTCEMQKGHVNTMHRHILVITAVIIVIIVFK